jgi:hypothetical protein
MGSVSRTIAEWFETNSPDTCSVIDARGAGSVYVSPFHTIAGLARLVILRLAGARVLHLQVSERLSFPRKAAFAMAGKAMGMRTIVHHHGAEFIPVFENASWLYRSIVRFVVRKADVNIVLGEPWHDFLKETVGLVAAGRTLYNSVADIQPQMTHCGRLKRKTRMTQFLFLANCPQERHFGVHSGDEQPTRSRTAGECCNCRWRRDREIQKGSCGPEGRQII